MSIQIKYNYLEQAYPDMLEGVGMLIQKAKLSARFDSVQLSIEEIEQLQAHLAAHKKDVDAKRSLLKKVAKRRKFLKYVSYSGLCSFY